MFAACVSSPRAKHDCSPVLGVRESVSVYQVPTEEREEP